MKNNYLFFLLILFLPSLAIAQDEGEVVKRERIDKSKSIYFLGGPSITSLKNDADYNTGINFELGYQKRLNRLVSIGFGISYINFPFSPFYSSEPEFEISYDDAFGYNFYFDEDANGNPNSKGYLVVLEGGDLSITSLSFNLKVNFIPVKDNSVFSLYGFAKPFVALANREAVNGLGFGYDYSINSDSWLYDENVPEEWNESAYPVLAKESKITGGMFLGLGGELFPAKNFSLFFQLSAGYTLPVNIVNFNEYNTFLEDYANPEFPMANTRFLTFNTSIGLSYNF